jgi:hypothetical protein
MKHNKRIYILLTSSRNETSLSPSADDISRCSSLAIFFYYANQSLWNMAHNTHNLCITPRIKQHFEPWMRPLDAHSQSRVTLHPTTNLLYRTLTPCNNLAGDELVETTIYVDHQGLIIPTACAAPLVCEFCMCQISNVTFQLLMATTFRCCVAISGILIHRSKGLRCVSSSMCMTVTLTNYGRLVRIGIRAVESAIL